MLSELHYNDIRPMTGGRSGAAPFLYYEHLMESI